MNFSCFLFFGLGHILFPGSSVCLCNQTLNSLGYCLFLCKHNLLNSDLFQNTHNRLLDLDLIGPHYSVEVVFDFHDSLLLAFLYHYFHLVDLVFLDYFLDNLLCIHLQLYILLCSLLSLDHMDVGM